MVPQSGHESSGAWPGRPTARSDFLALRLSFLNFDHAGTHGGHRQFGHVLDAEFLLDAVKVGAHGVGAEVEAVGHFGHRVALGELQENVEFLVGEGFGRVFGAVGAVQLGGDVGVEVALAGGNQTGGAKQFVRRAAFAQVAGGAGPDGAFGGEGVAVGRGDQHAGGGLSGEDALQRREAAAAGHRQIHHQHVGFEFGHEALGGFAAVGFGQHRGADAFEEQAETHAHDGVVVGEHEALVVEPGIGVAGHDWAGSGAVALAWTNDLSSSPLIDAGMPTSASWTNEPIPNGGRVNIGLYGGTEWASKTATNSALYLLSWNNGGVVTGQVMLTWRAAGLATNHTVRLDVSPDNGDTWVRVADGLPATLGGVAWNSLSMAPTPVALWRVQDEVEEDIEAISAVNFVVHNGPIAYYVNDESTDGDIYCSAAGSASGTGRSPDSPMLWISDVLSTYNVGPGDRIYVDTGRYYRESPTVFRDVDAGAVSQNPAEQVNVIGSTNSQAGGSPITRPGATRKSMVCHYFVEGVICYHEMSQRPALMKEE